jgi:homoserine kinase
MSPTFESFWASVPATSANLGPGFDTIGIALDLRLVARVAPSDHFSLVFVHGPHAPSHDGFADLIRSAMLAVHDTLPNATVVVNNQIPLGKGLGSSAAAIVLGLRIGAHCAGRKLAPNDLAKIATQLEGHADNALPALFGGMVIAAQDPDGTPRYVRVPAPRDLAALVTVPDLELSTSDSRAVLPANYSSSDALYTAQRAALLAAALCNGRWSHLREAMKDRMHQPYRAKHIPGLAQALLVKARGLHGVALSGAGPSVLALADRTAPSQPIVERIQRCFTRERISSHTLNLRIANRGAQLSKA